MAVDANAESIASEAGLDDEEQRRIVADSFIEVAATEEVSSEPSVSRPSTSMSCYSSLSSV